jgi:hypothetical protein
MEVDVGALNKKTLRRAPFEGLGFGVFWGSGTSMQH